MAEKKDNYQPPVTSGGSHGGSHGLPSQESIDLLTRLLQASGALVLAAGSAAEGLSLLSRARPAVVICDIGMPGSDGYNFIRRVRDLPAERGGRTPAIALTAFARAEDRERALAAGYDLHMPKPVEGGALLAAVMRFAGLPAAR